MSVSTKGGRTYLLFVYGTLLSGEASHGLLEGARPLGPATTPPTYDLVDLGPHPGLVAGGTSAVTGELYEVPPAVLAAVDVHEGHPVLFKRTPIALADGRAAETYLLGADQTRGRRRIRSGDWRTRNAPALSAARDGAFARWARTRRG